MKNKKILATFAIIIAGLVTLFLKVSKPASQENTDKVIELKNEFTPDVVREQGVDKLQTVDGMVSERLAPLTLKEKHRKVLECKELIRKREAEGLPVSDMLETGMIALEKALQIASQHARETSNINRPPDVVLINGFYIISYRNHDNLFRAGDPGYDCRIAIDARTSEFISVEDLNSGVVGIRTSRKTGAGMVDEAPQAEVYKEKLFDGLKELHRRVFHGQQLGSNLQTGMVTSEEAVKDALEQVAERKYDRSREPWPILVNDIYIVTFWNTDTDQLPDGWPTYDSRVGIDAHTGEFIAMETTRKRRPPIGKDVEE